MMKRSWFGTRSNDVPSNKNYQGNPDKLNIIIGHKLLLGKTSQTYCSLLHVNIEKPLKAQISLPFIPKAKWWNPRTSN